MYTTSTLQLSQQSYMYYCIAQCMNIIIFIVTEEEWSKLSGANRTIKRGEKTQRVSYLCTDWKRIKMIDSSFMVGWSRELAGISLKSLFSIGWNGMQWTTQSSSME